MSRVHKGVKALQGAAPWYYRPLLYFYSLAKYPMRLWRRYKGELGPALAIQAGRWNSNRAVKKKYAQQQGFIPGPMEVSQDPFDKWGRMRKGWLYDIPPSRAPQRSYVRPANAPKSTEWKPESSPSS